MFAARLNQENAVYEQQVAAAAKPLNQGVKGLAPKTPLHKQNAPKTPFRTNRNNENAIASNAKTGAKGGKIDKNTFVTPANPRTRAPLGVKTTNAKALQTPVAPQTQERESAKPSSPRLRRSKIKVHGTETRDVLLSEPEEREIEYMPPRETPLPDHPDEIWPHDREYPELQGKNFTSGWWSVYAGKNDDDVDEFSDWEEKLRKSEAQARQHKEREARLKDVTPSTAASALSSRSATKTAPGFMASSASARARQMPLVNTSLPIAKNPRFNAAKAASNSTIGYSKGRVVSASTRRPLSNLHDTQRGKETAVTEQQNEVLSATPSLLSEQALAGASDEDTAFPSISEMSLEDELEDFKLQLPD